uniref:Uncharacterized protein n=2 Tax=Salix viminalis TaxID=40686 RepID=A0A6N2M8U2_SALVM
MLNHELPCILINPSPLHNASLIHLRHLHSASLILTFTAPPSLILPFTFTAPPFNLCKNHLTNSSALPFSFTLPSPPSPSSSARRTHLISPSLVLAVSATDPHTNLLFLSTKIFLALSITKRNHAKGIQVFCFT